MSQRIKLFLLSTFVLFAASLNTWAYDDWTSTNTGDGSTSSSKSWDTFSVPAGKYVLVDYEVNGADNDYLQLYANFSGTQYIYGKKSGTFVIYNSASYSQTLRINADFRRYNGGDGYAKVTNIRIADAAPKLKFTEISLANNKNVELGVNTAYQNLSVTSAPLLYANRSYMAKYVTWKSSNEKIAKVDANGNVTGVGAGTATITVTTIDGSNLSASCNVTVKKTEKITLYNTYVGIKNSYSKHIKTSVTPYYCSNTFTWKSSDESIATVDNSGNVKGIKEGTVTITATATDGSGVSGSRKFTVTPGYAFDHSLYGNGNINYAYSNNNEWDYLYVKEYGSAYYTLSNNWEDNCNVSGYGTKEIGSRVHINFTSDKYFSLSTYGYCSEESVIEASLNGNEMEISAGWSSWSFNDGTGYNDYHINNTILPAGTYDFILSFERGSGYSDKDFITFEGLDMYEYSKYSWDDIIASNNVKMETVTVSRDGILGAEALKIHDNLKDFNGLKVVGPLDEYDWKTIREMDVICLDLTEASGVYPNSSDLTSVKAVKMSNNITNIERNYFPYAVYFYIPDGVKAITAKNFGTSRDDILTIDGCKGITTLSEEVFSGSNIGGKLTFNSLTNIPRKAFYNCCFLEGISVPKAKTVGTSAFEMCKTLSSVSMPIVNKIDTCAFSNCTLLSVISMPKVEIINVQAFAQCENIDKINAPLLKKVNNAAFCQAKINEVSLAVADTICDNAFAAASLNVVSLPKVKYIGKSAFSSEYSYTVNNGSWSSTTEYATSKTKISKIDIPSVEEIDSTAFYAQSDIETLVTPKLKKVGYKAFYNGNSLKNIDLSSVKEIGNNTFYRCYNLLDIDLSNVQSLGGNAFYDCGNLTSISLPNVSKINPGTFYNCNHIKSLDAPRATYIGYEAFRSCNSLETINILKADTIGNNAFYGCSKIKQVNLPKVAFLGSSAFYNCTSVKDIELSDKLTALGENSFYGCTGVETLTLPASITKIPTNCFAGSNNIKAINCNAPAPPAVGETPFNMQTLYTATLRVPEPSIGLYQADTYWKHFYYYDTNPDVLTDLILSNVTDMGDVRMEKVNLTMNIGSCLSMSGNDAQSFRSVTFKANNTGTGMFISSSERISSDDTKIEFNMDGLKWYFISLPYDVNISDIERSTEGTQLAIYKYDGAKRASSGTGYAWTRVNSGTLAMGTGYILQVSKATTLTFPASFAQKDKAFQPYDVTTKLSANTSSTAANQGWNFVGNPYLAYYDISKLDFSAPVTVWTGSTYAAYTPSDDEFALKPMQPFFVQCPTNVKSIKFSAEGRQATATITKAAEARERGNVKSADRRVVDIAIYSDSEAEDDHTRFVVNSRATDDYEMNCDAAKMMSMDDNVAQIYTVSRGVQYAINEGPQLTGEVQIGFRTPKAGTYTLKAVRSDMDVMLLDEVTGETVNLSEGAYTFNAEEEVNETRFRVVLGSEITDINDMDADKAGEGTELYDLSGRRTAEPAKGVSIMRQNGKVSKQMNR